MQQKRKIMLYSSAVLLAMASAGPAMAADLTPKQELGKAIFVDKALSINENQSCEDCHGPGAGWTGPDSAINEGGAVYEGSILGRFGNRKPPSAAYATTSPIFHWQKQKGGSFVGGNFWDGRATGFKLGNPAADQAQGPFVNPAEQALPDDACVVWKVCTAAYPVSMDEVWGADTCEISWPADVATVCTTEGATVGLSEADRAKSNSAYDMIALSIAAYEDSPEVNAFTAKYDYSFMGMATLSQQERKGYALFKGKGKCNRCHIDNGPGALFTDYTYDNLGLPPNPDNPANADPDFVDLGLGGYLEKEGYLPEVFEKEKGKHKVPTLRNADKRPDEAFFTKAFGHNGVFKSLKEIVHFYNTRDILPYCEDLSEPHFGVDCWPAPEVTDNINTSEMGNLGLTPAEEDAIVAFMKTLSDGYQP